MNRYQRLRTQKNAYPMTAIITDIIASAIKPEGLTPLPSKKLSNKTENLKGDL